MIIVSACLAGINCRYDGGNTKKDELLDLVMKGEALPLCPEILGDLPSPRPPCEIQIDNNGEKRVFTKDGKDLTKEFTLGAERTLAIAKAIDAKKAILQARSPSCGVGRIYDGSFSGKKIDGAGITAEMLLKNGIEVISINNG